MINRDGGIKILFNEINAKFHIDLVATVKNRMPGLNNKDQAFIGVRGNGLRKPRDERQNKTAIKLKRVRLELGRRKGAIVIKLLLKAAEITRKVAEVIDDGTKLRHVDGVETRGFRRSLTQRTLQEGKLVR